MNREPVTYLTWWEAAQNKSFNEDSLVRWGKLEDADFIPADEIVIEKSTIRLRLKWWGEGGGEGIRIYDDPTIVAFQILFEEWISLRLVKIIEKSNR